MGTSVKIEIKYNKEKDSFDVNLNLKGFFTTEIGRLSLAFILDELGDKILSDINSDELEKEINLHLKRE